MKARKKKQRLRKEADKLWFQVVMERYHWKSLVSGKPATQVHHFFPKSLYGHLRYDLDNGIPLTQGEHFAHHHRGDPTIHQTIIKKKGRKWYEKLLHKAHHTHKRSYQTIKYYEDIIKWLKSKLQTK